MDKGTCSVVGCDRPDAVRGLCRGHHQRVQRTGDPGSATFRKFTRPTVPPEDDPTRPRCGVEGCELAAATRGWCKGHYKRWWDKGDPGPAEFRSLRFDCQVDGCKRPHSSGGWCELHYRRVRAGVLIGSRKFLAEPQWAEHVTYHAVHGQLVAQRGRAADLTCGCGNPAKDWAYQHNDPDALVDERGYFYSLKFDECYTPMCRSCHNLLDRDPDRRESA